MCMKFCVRLKHSSLETIQMIQKAEAMGTWYWQFHHDNVLAHLASRLVQFFGETSNHPGDLSPLQPRIGALQRLAAPKTKITFEREEISDHQ